MRVSKLFPSNLRALNLLTAVVITDYNGESHFKVGESMGTAMLKLMKP